jgi:DNA helicase II / ATP-dependent DNA helicase PcrA
MRFIADLHLHSKYSRACSKELTLPNIAKACERKGIQIVGTSDFTHPAWRSHIGEELESAANGVFALKGGRSPVRFILSTEVSCIYKRNGKTRRVHHVILMPDLASVDRFIASLEKRGINIKADGRPIMGLDSEELIKLVLDASPDALLIPAHAWTPWFAVFGSQSGFDSLDECFGEMATHVHAIETGLSSDPPMNRRLSALDSVFLVSNSDAHSLDKLGREANVFEMDAPSFSELRRIFIERDRTKFIETIEFFPEEGKYHADGHAACAFSCEPKETRRLNGLCPVCGKPLTIGVLNRVDAIADRPSDDLFPTSAVPFRYIIPLAELVGGIVGTSPSSKKVRATVDRLVEDGRSEFGILLDISIEKLREIAPIEGIAEAIAAMREGRVTRTPGYDGIYGKIRVESPMKSIQASLL